MKTRRPLSINNSLSHGICNYDCETCGVNKASYRGPQMFQPLAVTEKLIARVEEAARAGIRVRYIANSGDGEPTLHPDFPARMDLFGGMIRGWDTPGVPAPEASVVTNGSRLLAPGILDAVSRNGLTLIVSLPTVVPENYGQLVLGRPEQGAGLLARVVPGIEAAMRETAAGRIPRLCFHVSPPDRDVVRKDFPRTVEFLASSAARAGMEKIELILFPATSNRSGLVRSRGSGVDFCPDLFKAWNGRCLDGVRVRMSISYRRFFPRVWEMFDLVRSFGLPCLWNAHLFITAGGESICCNDQTVRAPRGSVLTDSIDSLMVRKEAHLPDAICAGCDQRPDRMRGGLLVKTFSLMARGRLALARLADGTRGRTLEEAAHAQTDDAVVVEGAQDAGRGQPGRRDIPGAGNGALADARLVSGGERGRGARIMRNRRLTEILRVLEEQVEKPVPGYRFGDGGEYRVRVASSMEDRLKAWSLVYRVYVGKEYAAPNSQRLWYGPHDALPDTTTLLVERQEPAADSSAIGIRPSDSESRKPKDESPKPGVPMATLTLLFDSPLGLPADKLYGAELDALRARGRRLCEIVSLVSEEKDIHRGAEIMRHAFKLAYLAASRLHRATDFLITVNPRHVVFYRRVLLMEERGPERAYDKVGGAPAVLLSLDLETAEERYLARYGQKPGSFFRFFVNPATEPAILESLTGSRRTLSQEELCRYFGEEPALLAGNLGGTRP